MCLRVDANGWGDGTGTHVSVHVFFMNAEYDQHMMNELTGSGGRSLLATGAYYVTIQLVNHKIEQGPHEKTVQYILNRGTFKGDTKHETSLGYGITQFISHDDLESSSDSRQFIINDCLTWRVSGTSIWD